jgi:hypothetical protein
LIAIPEGYLIVLLVIQVLCRLIVNLHTHVTIREGPNLILNFDPPVSTEDVV